MSEGVLRILVVEDDDVEIMAMQRALTATKREYVMKVARDGVEAFALLRGEPSGSERENVVAPFAPELVFLDLNMPRMNGLEFLRELRQRREYASLNVVVVTTSSAEEDRRAALEYRVSGYVVKSDYVGNFKGFANEIATHLGPVSQVIPLRGPETVLIVAGSARANAVRAALGDSMQCATVDTMTRALAATKRRDFGAIIVDASPSSEPLVHMLAELKRRNAHAPVIVISHVVDDEARAKAIRDGADDVLFGDEQLANVRHSIGSAFLRAQHRRSLLNTLSTLDRIACLDPVTEVWSRRGFELVLQSELGRSMRQSSNAMVLLIECDSVIHVQEVHGAAVADTLLAEVAKRIRATVRCSDHVGRVGSHEFLVLLSDVTEPVAEVMAARVRAAIAAPPIVVGNTPFRERTTVVAYPVSLQSKTVTEILHRVNVPLRARERRKRAERDQVG